MNAFLPAKLLLYSLNGFSFISGSSVARPSAADGSRVPRGEAFKILLDFLDNN
jgi:hypothetical protein